MLFFLFHSFGVLYGNSHCYYKYATPTEFCIYILFLLQLYRSFGAEFIDLDIRLVFDFRVIYFFCFTSSEFCMIILIAITNMPLLRSSVFTIFFLLQLFRSFGAELFNEIRLNLFYSLRMS